MPIASARDSQRVCEPIAREMCAIAWASVRSPIGPTLARTLIAGSVLAQTVTAETIDRCPPATKRPALNFAFLRAKSTTCGQLPLARTVTLTSANSEAQHISTVHDRSAPRADFGRCGSRGQHVAEPASPDAIEDGGKHEAGDGRRIGQAASIADAWTGQSKPAFVISKETQISVMPSLCRQRSGRLNWCHRCTLRPSPFRGQLLGGRPLGRRLLLRN
jgi:hypothetical protein